MYNFKEEWINNELNKFKLVYPDDDESVIRKFLSDKFDEDFVNNKCILYNNYEKTEIDTSIYKMINWVKENKPIITESGTLFKHHEEVPNPNADILNNFLTTRKKKKKQMFEFKDKANKCMDPAEKAKLSYAAAKANMGQLREKNCANSYYGASGEHSSWFFNMACAMSTTARGQALISTAMNAFEDFLSDNVKFFNMDECIEFINNTTQEKSSRKYSDENWVEDIDDDELIDRLNSKFLDSGICDITIIKKIISSLSQEDKNRVYYKSNIEKFILRSRKAKQLLTNIVMSGIEFNDANEVPKELSGKLDKLCDAMLEYVHYNYAVTNRVYRLKTQQRRRVITIDTDSNFLNLGPWVEFVHNNIVSKYVHIKRRDTINGMHIISSHDKYNRYDNIKNENRDFIIINTIVYIATAMMNKTLSTFLLSANIDPNGPGTTAMKNEFVYKSILLTPAKKHYQGAVRLQEGVGVPQCSIDVKGMEFRKTSHANAYTRKFIENLIFDDILMADNLQPDIRKILNKLRDFEAMITKSVMNGEDKFLKMVNVKTADAYAEPLSIGAYKAVYVWNKLYPDMAIDLPGTAYVLKVKLNKPKMFTQLSVTEPEIYGKLMELFSDERIAKSGINNIALPIDEKVPDWLKPYINVEEIISNNTSLIYSVLNCISIKTIQRTSKSQFFSTIIDI